MPTANKFGDEATAIFLACNGKLSRKHAAELADSAMSPEIVRLRSYQTITNESVLAVGWGFTEYQRRVPGLLVPSWDVHGEQVGCQFKPDNPRTNSETGKIGKYESPNGSRNILDVPPSCYPQLNDPNSQLWVTEGRKKADSLATIGVCCVSITGVDAWRGTNEHGATMALPCLDSVALKGRIVVLMFDSDVISKPSVHLALGKLSIYLESRGAKVMIAYFPKAVLSGTKKIGIDDFLAAGFKIDELEFGPASVLKPSKEGDAAALEAMSKLPDVEYDQQREDIAKDLGIRKSTLDKERAKLQAAKEAPKGPEIPEPATAPVDGQLLFDDLRNVFSIYMATLSDENITALGLWVIRTFAMDAVEYSPILCITSPRPRCGKSRLLSLLEVLALKPMLAVSITAAALYRTIDKWRPTMLIDEADTIFTKNAPNEELRSILDAGNTRGTTVPRCSGDNHDVVLFEVFCPKALAAIGALPGTIMDRGINIRLERRKPDETISKLQHKQREDLKTSLRPRCLRWITDHMISLKSTEPDLPWELNANDRGADYWRPLLAIAKEIGGEAPQLAAKAAARLSGETPDPTEDLATELLKDLKAIFQDMEATALPSAVICAALAAMAERPWPAFGKTGKPVTQNQLGWLLRNFTTPSGLPIKSKAIRPKYKSVPDSEKVSKGYTLEDLQAAFDRYAPAEPEDPDGGEECHNEAQNQPETAPETSSASSPHFQTVTVVTTAVPVESNALLRTVTENVCNGSQSDDSTYAPSACNHVTVQKPPYEVKEKVGSETAETVEQRLNSVPETQNPMGEPDPRCTDRAVRRKRRAHRKVN